MSVNLQMYMAPQQVFISTGSNEGSRLANLRKAAKLCALHIGKPILQSSIYETAAWGITDQNSFLNQVLVFESNLSPAIIMETLLQIERDMGRVRAVKWGPRKIDLDILFIDGLMLQTAGLQIPHPQIQNRRFVLIPLVEIAPNLIHPVFRKSMVSLLLECEDSLEVIKTAS
jgi:2-amino-4-hydroxy-6-hydroxymethyldihydropteridine diphosphokinase